MLTLALLRVHIMCEPPRAKGTVINKQRTAVWCAMLPFARVYNLHANSEQRQAYSWFALATWQVCADGVPTFLADAMISVTRCSRESLNSSVCSP